MTVPSPWQRFTEKNVKKMLEQWPQAVSVDHPEIRELFDRAQAGAKTWGEKLYRPDYFWSSCVDMTPPTSGQISKVYIAVPAPCPGEPDANLGPINFQPVEEHLAGRYRLSGTFDWVIEVKKIEADHTEKLRRYTDGIGWEKYLDLKLAQAFSSLQHADKQIRDGKRLLGHAGTRGSVFVINEALLKTEQRVRLLSREIAEGFLAEKIKSMEHIDTIVYLQPGRPSVLCNSAEKHRHELVYVSKGPPDDQSRAFSAEIGGMFDAFDWSTGVPDLRGGSLQQMNVKIEIDERTRWQIENWCTGWRVADDGSGAEG